VDSLHDLGAEEVITTCPECYRTMAYDYPAYGIKPEFKLTHMYEFLENQIDKSAVAFNEMEEAITYQDSCRLNQVGEIKDLPRKLINRLTSEAFKEMKDSENAALCCGNCAWIGCDAYSKALQVRHIQQAHATGSDLLVTSCPKCQIHLRCAMEDPFRSKTLMMEMKDLTSVIAKHIYWE
jgi:heterodisulfide reductase subunit D